MTLGLRGQIEKERAKIKRQMSKILMRYDGDLGVVRYLRLASDEWVEPVAGVRQNLCALSGVQRKLSISNVAMEPNSVIPNHMHDNHETIFVVDGQVRETCSGRVLRTGESMVIAEGVQHGLSSDEGALLNLTWRPALEDDQDDCEDAQPLSL